MAALRARVLAEASELLSPSREMTVDEWAREHRVLSDKETSSPGRWDSGLTPYLAAPMNALGTRGVDEVILMCCSQAGKSEATRNALGYWISQDPGPCVWVLPSESAAKEILEDRLIPMIENSAPWAIPRRRNSIGQKALKLHSMVVYPGWAGSPGTLAMRPCRYAIGDEVDKWPDFSGKDASPRALLQARLRTYEGRSKFVLVSTPTSRSRGIAVEFASCADQRDFRLPCHHCAELMPMKWSVVRWPEKIVGEDRDAQAERIYTHQLAWIECPHCKGTITESQRRAAIRHGDYVSTLGLVSSSFSRAVAFQFNALVNPWTNIHKLVRKWLKSQGHPEKLQEFINQELGEPMEDLAEATIKTTLKTEGILGEIPRWATALTATADTQAGYFVWVVCSHGRGGRSLPIACGSAANTSELRSHTVDAYYPLEGSEHRFAPSCLLIDSGGSMQFEEGGGITDQIYQFCETDPGMLMPVKGRAKAGPETKLYENRLLTPKPGMKRKFTQVTLRLLHTQALKDILDQRRRDGLFSVPLGISPEFVKQMDSERKTSIRRGAKIVTEWRKVAGHTVNDFYDCMVYQVAAALIVNANGLAELGEIYGQDAPKRSPRAATNSAAEPIAGQPSATSALQPEPSARASHTAPAAPRAPRQGLGPGGQPFLRNRRPA